ncbi:MAG: serine/threonine-protein phosphatase, partial [Frankiales bacterium]|nr:serine/threonine-protein phosphatase [Frankiales bacterium]
MDEGGRPRPLRLASAVALLIALIATAAATWGAYSVVHDQERRLLKERGSELNLVLTSTISTISSGLASQGEVLRASHFSKPSYLAAAGAAAAAPSPTPLTFAWLRPAPSGTGFVVLAATGDGLSTGQVITDARATTMAAALHTPEMLATPLIGPHRILGFVLGPPAAPAGTVLYRQTPLGPLKAPRAASSAPFAELDLVIYGSSRPDPRMVLASTTAKLPLHGDVQNDPLVAGGSHWLVSIKAKRPLVGSAAANLWWIALLAGLAGSVLIASVIETVARRRDDALALYAKEHEVAETLQRSLLPQLPEIAGLEFAARYLAGGVGQEVGGDWFDVFPVGGGRVGVAVGDVIGHDLAAASAMAQVRAALRAFAIDGDQPAPVLNRLDHLVETLNLTQLVTVVYGVLDPPAEDGSRRFTFSNAGHLAPLLRSPDGSVEQLAGGDSVLIGAPIDVEHQQVARILTPGSTLVLFTDGLIEVPGQPLEEKLDQLTA